MIKDAVREVGLMKELCEHLQGIGVKAILLQPGSTEALGPRWKMGIFASGSVLGCVKVEGRNLDMVQVERNISNPPSGSQLSSQTAGRLQYQYHYLVRRNINGLENRLKAELAPVKKQKGQSKEALRFQWVQPRKISFGNIILGLFFVAFPAPALWIATRQSVPIPIILIFLVFFAIGLGLVFVSLVRWRSGRRSGYLAQQLNNDSYVRGALLKAGTQRLVIRPDRRNQCVRITPISGPATKITLGPVSIDALGRKQFPTREAFEAYDKIAQCIRRIESKTA